MSIWEGCIVFCVAEEGKKIEIKIKILGLHAPQTHRDQFKKIKPVGLIFCLFQSKLIPLRAKREGEFFEIRHKKISPTPILSNFGCL